MFIPHSHYIEILAIYHKLDSEKLTKYFNLIDYADKERQELIDEYPDDIVYIMVADKGLKRLDEA